MDDGTILWDRRIYFIIMWKRFLNTNKKNVYVIKGKDGTLYKNGEIWIAEYYKNDQLVKEEYQIKF